MKRSEILLTLLQVPTDFFAILCAGWFAYSFRFTSFVVGIKPVQFTLSIWQFMEIAFWFSWVWIAVLALLGLYQPKQNRKLGSDIITIAYGTTIGLGLVAVYALFFQVTFDSRFLILFSYLFAFFFLVFSHIFLRVIRGVCYRNGVGLTKIVLIGTSNLTKELERLFLERKELGYEVAGIYSSFSSSTKQALKKLHFDELILTNPRASEKETMSAMAFARERHKLFRYTADLFATYSHISTVEPVGGIPVVSVRPNVLGLWGRVIKRLFDIVCSLIILLICSPLYALVSLGILIETGLPVIYKNERVGLRGRKFFVYKFRSMFQKDSTGPQFGASGKTALKREAELIKKQNSKTGPIYKIENDPRITKFGAFLRKTSLDELPQFVNVLKGEMSVVGPRPHQPREVEKYEKTYTQIFTLKPGITGLAQISGRSDLTFDQEMALDVFYTEEWSLFLDLIICIKTPFILLRKRKAL